MGGGVGVSFQVYSDLAALSLKAAEQVVRSAQLAIGARGRFTLALAGGNTPRPLYRLLAGPFREQIDWSRVHLFWGDERYVLPDHSQSNLKMVQESLIQHLPIPPAQIFPMSTELKDPDQAAWAYQQTLQTQLGHEGLDLALLGMGADGHTASLFPGTPAAAERDRWVVAVQAQAEPPVRLSLTVPVLTQARQLLFLVSGADKGPVWRAIRTDPQGAAHLYPAAMVSLAGTATWLLDQAVHAKD